MSAEKNTKEKAFKDNKRQRGQHNVEHNGHRQNRLKMQELEGHRENQDGHHKPGTHPHLKTSKNEK